jgi:hypothetical protein
MYFVLKAVSNHYFVRFLILMAASMMMIAFWDTAMYNLIQGDQHFTAAFLQPPLSYIALMMEAVSTFEC